MTHDPKRIHVVFKTHLDIGYTDLEQNVIQRYMTDFFPKAIEAAEHFAEHSHSDAFIWSTGSWLIDYALKHGKEDEKAAIVQAIEKGHLAWHALPFTFHTELLDPELLDYSLNISKTLDQRFGRQTIAAKMTDVPGHTRSMVTHLAKAGIKYLHIGVNPSSHVPHVPELFLWRNQDGSEIVVQYSNDYGDSLQVEGLEDVLYFAHTHDNHGPSSVKQIEDEFNRLRKAYPNADIAASTMDQYAEKVWAIKDSLPVVEEEIGDTWIHGTSTDPYKLAAYRALLRLKSKWLQEGSLSPSDEEYVAFCDELMMIPEHTWGVDIKRYLADYAHYDKDDFQAARRRGKTDVSANPMIYRFLEENSRAEINEMFGEEAQAKLESRSFQIMEKSWQDQRDHLTKAVNALQGDRKQEAEAALEALQPKKAKIEHAKDLVSQQTYTLGLFQVTFAEDGSIIGLQDKNGKNWASDKNRLGQFIYDTYAQEDYDRWYREYHRHWGQTHFWVVGDFGKPGMDLTNDWVERQSFTPKLVSLTHSSTAENDIVVAKVSFPEKAYGQMGAPREVEIEYTFPAATTTVEMTCKWFGKDAHRLPEASWLTFNPVVDNCNLWKLDKLGQAVSPLEVVKGGNRNMHAVNQGVDYRGADGEVAIEMLDTAIVCPGERRLLQFDHSFASLTGGIHVNLHNNVWGTNFPAWYEGDALSRFKLRFTS
ncbi:DUF5054 domain-containing protein [Bacillaceae bacterium SIJ1]|nr:DUF5054 domain-containing protein [Litoribacterium kuwaitense]NGP44801.1 DUF5054 domain-containing protein [Litoribacterium kuwaitense]